MHTQFVEFLVFPAVCQRGCWNGRRKATYKAEQGVAQKEKGRGRKKQQYFD